MSNKYYQPSHKQKKKFLTCLLVNVFEKLCKYIASIYSLAKVMEIILNINLNYDFTKLSQKLEALTFKQLKENL
jgi:hypothetical protein